MYVHGSSVRKSKMAAKLEKEPSSKYIIYKNMNHYIGSKPNYFYCAVSTHS